MIAHLLVSRATWKPNGTAAKTKTKTKRSDKAAVNYPTFIVYDVRGIQDPDEAQILTVAHTRKEAIRDCRDQGNGCVYDDGYLTFWKDGGREWDANNESDRS